MDVAVSQVATGSTAYGACPDCGADRAVTDVQALTESGTLTIAAIVNCDGCGDAWLCALCPSALPLDGKTTHRHIARAHGAAI
jgi:hypothetical protein